MIRVTVELVPYGDESLKKKIGSLVVANMGTKGLTTGDYWYNGVYEDDTCGKHYAGALHTRKNGIWHLLHLLLSPLNKIPLDVKDATFKRLEESL